MLLTRMLKVLLLAGVLAVGAAFVTYWFAPSAFLRGAVATERWSAGLARHEKQVDGFRIVYLDSGGSGEPVVLVHGFGGEKDNWVRTARLLRPKVRVIALDLPGYGESDSPLDGSYTIADQVEHLHAFIAALGLTHVSLGGHSMGGNVVATYAAKYPNEVGSLWLIANSGINAAPPSELRQRIADTGVNALVPGSVEEYREMMKWVMARPPYLPDRLLQVLAERAVANRELRTRQFAQLVKEASTLEARINGLPIPTHVLWGELDRAVHVDSVNMLMGLLPNSDRTLMPGVGHVPMLEAPEETARDYLAFRKHYRL
jgi:pimeloyl-ACP methyl ester carboxylesterase